MSEVLIEKFDLKKRVRDIVNAGKDPLRSISGETSDFDLLLEEIQQEVKQNTQVVSRKAASTFSVIAENNGKSQEVLQAIMQHFRFEGWTVSKAKFDTWLGEENRSKQVINLQRTIEVAEAISRAEVVAVIYDHPIDWVEVDKIVKLLNQELTSTRNSPPEVLDNVMDLSQEFEVFANKLGAFTIVNILAAFDRFNNKGWKIFESLDFDSGKLVYIFSINFE